MWIKSVVLNRFKSFNERIEINGFDQYLNAINDLDKNLLEAICFLLGITNLADVSEVVQKNRIPHGLNKGYVSIIFDNTDVRLPSFEELNEIIITRQVTINNPKKYLINGREVSNTLVQELFGSVHLDVSNPNFIITQDRIKKVLDMKPSEILSMIGEASGTIIGEAAGTTMNKKESSHKSMEKNDARIIDDMLNEDIMMKLNEDRVSYLEYQEIFHELKDRNKSHLAFRYFCCKEAKKKHKDELRSLEVLFFIVLPNIDRRRQNNKKEIEEIQDKRGNLEAALEALQGQLEQALIEETKVTSSMKDMNKALETNRQKLQQMERQLAEEHNKLPAKKKKLQKLKEELEMMRERNEKDKQTYREAVRHLQAARIGLNKSEVSKYKEELDQFKKSIEKLEKLNYEENSEEKFQEEIKRLKSKSSRFRKNLINLEARSHQLRLEHHDPELGLDMRPVKGLLAKVKDANNVTVLEVVAAGKLYQLFVDNELTSQKILDRGMVRNRITIIPLDKTLDKTLGQPMPEHVVMTVQSLLGRENVSTALSLVGSNSELEAAMAYVFGTSFVYVNLDNARKSTFHYSIHESVTISGDSSDAAGIASGGARAHQTDSTLLREIKELTLTDQSGEQLNESSATKEKYSRRAEMMQNEDADMNRKVKRAKIKRTEVKRAEVKRTKVNLKNAKTELEASDLKLENKEQEHHNLKLEIRIYEKALKELAKKKEEMEEKKAEIKRQEEEWTAAKAKVACCQEAINKQKEVSKNFTSDLEKIYREQQDLEIQKNSILLKKKEFGLKLEQIKRDAEEIKEEMEASTSETPQIDEEEEHFNQPNTIFDFKNDDMKEKKKSLLKDRNEIRETMDTINEKNLVVNDAFNQINRDFGFIFSILLPGASAKLIPADGSTIQSGVEFKVGFGGIWKESLNKLSGGHWRSLMALSLLLAMLLYNRSPLCILDEVDSALDICHPQNIRLMLRTLFKHTQFIVVSEKDNVLNSANVLFKTRSVDGVSTVTRCAQNQSNPLHSTNEEGSPPILKHALDRKQIVSAYSKETESPELLVAFEEVEKNLELSAKLKERLKKNRIVEELNEIVIVIDSDSDSETMDENDHQSPFQNPSQSNSKINVEQFLNSIARMSVQFGRMNHPTASNSEIEDPSQPFLSIDIKRKDKVDDNDSPLSSTLRDNEQQTAPCFSQDLTLTPIKNDRPTEMDTAKRVQRFLFLDTSLDKTLDKSVAESVARPMNQTAMQLRKRDAKNNEAFRKVHKHNKAGNVKSGTTKKDDVDDESNDFDFEAVASKKPAKRRKRHGWTEEDENLLRHAVSIHKKGNWRKIQEIFFPNRSNVHLKDKWRSMEKYGNR